MSSFAYANLGSTANDGTGDPVRVAFQKINNNFGNLHATGIDNTNLIFSGNSILSSGNINLYPSAGLVLANSIANLYIGGGNAGQFITAITNSGQLAWSNGVAGLTGQIQFNSANRFAASAGLTFNTNNNALSVSGAISTGGTISAPNISIAGTSYFLGDLNVSGRLTAANVSFINATTSNVANLQLILASGVNTVAGLNTAGVVFGQVANSTPGLTGVSILYNAVSNSLNFSRAITINGTPVVTQNGTIQSTEATFDLANVTVLYADTAYLPDANANYVYVSTTQAANSTQAMVGTLLTLENTSNIGNGLVGFQLLTNSANNANVANANSINTNNNGYWSVYTEAVTGNLSFVGSTTNANATFTSNVPVAFGQDGAVLANYYQGNGSQLFSLAVGANTAIQYNNQGNLAADPAFTYANNNQLLTVGNLNVVGNYFTNGVLFRYIPAGPNLSVQFNNGNIANGSSALTFNPTANLLTVAGNVTANYVFGNIQFANGYNSYSNANVASYLPTYTGNVSANNISANSIVANSIVTNATTTTANLTVSKISSLGPVGNVKITGGTTGQVLQTDGTGNLSFVSTSLALIPTVGTTLASYTVLPTDYYVGVNCASTSVVTLFQGNTSINGRQLIIKDESGTLVPGVKTLTISVNPADTFEGILGGIYIFEEPFTSVALIYRGTGWWII